MISEGTAGGRCYSPRSPQLQLSSRHLLPGAISTRAPALVDGWSPGTRPGMTLVCVARSVIQGISEPVRSGAYK
jgi:hypothetical protein